MSDMPSSNSGEDVVPVPPLPVPPLPGPDDGGSTSYNPTAVQAMIKALLGGPQIPGEPLSVGAMTYLMYLMQQFGLQVVGLDANIQGQMNQFFNYIQDMNAQIHEANGSTSSENSLTSPTCAFKNDMNQLLDALTDPNNPNYQFFNGGAGSQLKSQIEAALNSVNNIQIETSSFTGTFSSDPNALEDMWKMYNGSAPTPGSTAAPTNDPAPMNTLMSQTGNLTQLYTGLSKAVQATTQSDASMQQTELGTLNNFLKKMNSWISMMIQQQKTQ